MSRTKKSWVVAKTSEIKIDEPVTRPLTPEELGKLAELLVKAKSRRKADALIEEMIRGFYGRP